MEMKQRIVYAAIWSAFTVLVFVTAVTIVADLFAPFKDWLAALFTHHWVGKSILASALFVVGCIVLSLLPLRANEEKIRRGLRMLAWSSCVGAVVILGFFIYEALGT